MDDDCDDVMGWFRCPDCHEKVYPAFGVLDLKRHSLLFIGMCVYCYQMGGSPKVMATVNIPATIFNEAMRNGLIWAEG